MKLPIRKNAHEKKTDESGRTDILVVEDDADIRDGIRILLSSEGYHVIEAEDGESALKNFRDGIDLIILDIMMPGVSGVTVCRKIRERSNVPVLFLTAKSREEDKLVGFMAGGDDYLTKPFSYGELLGRVKALLRRYQVYQGKEEAPAASEYIERAGIRVSREFNRVIVDGSVKNLTEIEYQLLLLMSGHPQKVFTAQELYEQIWKEPYFYSCSNTLMVHIRNLRMKIERNPQEPARICTVWGKGYMFNERNQ